MELQGLEMNAEKEKFNAVLTLKSLLSLEMVLGAWVRRTSKVSPDCVEK